MKLGHVCFAAVALVACAQPTLDPPAEIIHARFDPEDGVIPMPSDVLRDDALGLLALPLEEANSEAERELFEYLNTLDGWSSASTATVEFTGPIAPATLNEGTVEIWHMRATPTRVTEATLSLDGDETTLSITPPPTGWERGGRYLIVLRGGAEGIEGKRGETVEADAAFYFLRLRERLDTPEHERAFPGASAEERREAARKLEEIRQELAPDFDFFETRGLARADIASLFSFTITDRVELAMDKASQRMPLPIDLLIDPATGRVELPPAVWDSPTVVEVKERLAELDGFATSAKLMFGFTGEIDPATITSDNVRLYDLSGPVATRVEARATVLSDRLHVEIEPIEVLKESRPYAISVTSAVNDAEGRPVIAMPLGRLFLGHSPVADASGKSLVGAASDDDAVRVERVRSGLETLFVTAPRGVLVTAWAFTTMSIRSRLAADLERAEAMGLSPHPANVVHRTPLQAIGEFPIAVGSLFFVEDVYHGTIETADFLDRETRGFRGDGQGQKRPIDFTLTVPNVAPGTTVPVVIFGHGVMTERRFVLAIGDALAARGFAAIAIDLPYHGERTHCFAEGPLSIPNPQTGELTPLGNPCASGGECLADGTCRNPDGSPGELAKWPIIGMYMSSGAAFLEIAKIANTRDHFRQSLIDLSALRRSLAAGDWRSQVGVHFDANNIYYAGQSLGGIVGATFLATDKSIARAVLNVPGADTVDLFRDSPFFGGQIEAFFTREGVDPEEFEGHRFLNVARWLMDTVDPQSFADELVGRPIMLQMATLDFIIPNAYTRRLEALSGLPRRDYLGEHAFLVIPIEPAYLRGTSELAEYLQGDFVP